MTTFTLFIKVLVLKRLKCSLTLFAAKMTFCVCCRDLVNLVKKGMPSFSRNFLQYQYLHINHMTCHMTIIHKSADLALSEFSSKSSMRQQRRAMVVSSEIPRWLEANGRRGMSELSDRIPTCTWYGQDGKGSLHYMHAVKGRYTTCRLQYMQVDHSWLLVNVNSEVRLDMTNLAASVRITQKLGRASSTWNSDFISPRLALFLGSIERFLMAVAAALTTESWPLLRRSATSFKPLDVRTMFRLYTAHCGRRRMHVERERERERERREVTYLPVACRQVLYGASGCLHSFRGATVLLNDSQVDIDHLWLPEQSHTIHRLTTLGHRGGVWREREREREMNMYRRDIIHMHRLNFITYVCDCSSKVILYQWNIFKLHVHVLAISFIAISDHHIHLHTSTCILHVHVYLHGD